MLGPDSPVGRPGVSGGGARLEIVSDSRVSSGFVCVFEVPVLRMSGLGALVTGGSGARCVSDTGIAGAFVPSGSVLLMNKVGGSTGRMGVSMGSREAAVTGVSMGLLCTAGVSTVGTAVLSIEGGAVVPEGSVFGILGTEGSSALASSLSEGGCAGCLRGFGH